MGKRRREKERRAGNPWERLNRRGGERKISRANNSSLVLMRACVCETVKDICTEMTVFSDPAAVTYPNAVLCLPMPYVCAGTCVRACLLIFVGGDFCMLADVLAEFGHHSTNSWSEPNHAVLITYASALSAGKALLLSTIPC